MILESYELAKAVVFFQEQRIVRSMLYTEFEAILDGYVPAAEFAGEHCQAVYVEVNAAFELATAVFFRIAFGRRGQIDPAWRLPLEQLAAMAKPIADITLGQFRLVSVSQCPIRYFQDYLWEPDFAGANRELCALQDFAKQNLLGIHFRRGAEKVGGEKPELAVPSAYTETFNAQLKSLRLQAAIIKKERDEMVAKLKSDHEQRIAEYRALFKEKDRQMKTLRASNQNLQEMLQGKDEKLAGLRSYYERKLDLAENQERELADSLYDNIEKEMQTTLDNSLREYKTLLKMREVEIQNCKEEERALKREVALLRQQNQELLAYSRQDLLQEMVAKGISLVSFQPGIGHINIPFEDIAKFTQGVDAYVAEVCGVSEEHYRQWQRHFLAPVCVAADENGQFCSENIARCEAPASFQVGVTDRCDKHKLPEVRENWQVISQGCRRGDITLLPACQPTLKQR